MEFCVQVWVVNGRCFGVSTFGQTFLQGVMSIRKAKFTESLGAGTWLVIINVICSDECHAVITITRSDNNNTQSTRKSHNNNNTQS